MCAYENSLGVQQAPRVSLFRTILNFIQSKDVEKAKFIRAVVKFRMIFAAAATITFFNNVIAALLAWFPPLAALLLSDDFVYIFFAAYVSIRVVWSYFAVNIKRGYKWRVFRWE